MAVQRRVHKTQNLTRSMSWGNSTDSRREQISPTGPTSEMLLGTDTMNALKDPGISELVEDTCAAKTRVDVADVVEPVREVMDTLATSSQGTGWHFCRWRHSADSRRCGQHLARQMGQGVLRQLRSMAGIPCATPCSASFVGEHVSTCLPTPEDFSNGCQLRGEAQLSIDEAQERGLAKACTRSRD